MDRQQSLFPVINLSRTGRNIEQCRRQAGLTVKDVQNYFGFEYPQAIYKWQHGECLPTEDNLLALAHLLDVPMENLLAYDDREVVFFALKACSHRNRCGHNGMRPCSHFHSWWYQVCEARMFALSARTKSGCIKARRLYTACSVLEAFRKSYTDSCRYSFFKLFFYRHGKFNPLSACQCRGNRTLPCFFGHDRTFPGLISGNCCHTGIQ